MKPIKHNAIRRKLPKVYRLPYSFNTFKRREYWISWLNYLNYRDVD